MYSAFAAGSYLGSITSAKRMDSDTESVPVLLKAASTGFGPWPWSTVMALSHEPKAVRVVDHEAVHAPAVGGARGLAAPPARRSERARGRRVNLDQLLVVALDGVGRADQNPVDGCRAVHLDRGGAVERGFDLHAAPVVCDLEQDADTAEGQTPSNCSRHCG